MIARWEVLAYSARFPPGRGFVMRLVDDAGHIGLGEARALEGFGSGPDTLQAFISASESVASLLDRIAAGDAPADAPVEALFAAEAALADLAAQRGGVALSEYLGCTPPQELPNSVLVDGEAQALRLLRAGHRQFKLKAQGVASDALDLLCRLHDASEGTARVRIDANGSWTRDDALEFLIQAPGDSVCFVEQPFPVGDLDSCVWLYDRVSLPIALDEGAESVARISEAARRGAAQLVVLKPMYRGLRGTLRLAESAAEHGLGACVTHAMDGTIGRLAAMHVAAAVDALCPDGDWPHGLYAHGLTRLAEEPAVHGDRLVMPAGPGLGCHDLRLDALERVCASQ